MNAAVRTAWIRAWRLGALLALAAVVGIARRTDADRGAMPIGIREVERLVPGAVSLDAEAGALGHIVRDAAGAPLGAVTTTAPEGDRAIGYAGPTEVLIALDRDGRVVGARIRRSADTPEHVAEVVADERFWGRVIGRSEHAVDGVSGATATSRAVSEAVALRLARATDGAVADGLHAGLHDLALALFAIGGIALASTRGARRLRPWFRVAAVAYLGVATGELLALSLGAGLAAHGMPWRRAPGLALLAATAWLVPWATGRSPYCAHVCPHGALQEWIGRAARGRVPRLRLPAGVRFGLRSIPVALLVVAVIALVVGLPLDLAGLEAFDAWLLGAGVAIALIGLAAAAFEPMAYCRFGCATGRLLALGATRSRARLDRRDAVLASLLALATSLLVARDAVHHLLMEVSL